MSTRAPGGSRLDVKRATAGLALIAAILGVLATTTSLFDWIGSKVSPAPRPPPPNVDARLLGVELRDTGTPLGDYLTETNQSAAGLTRHELLERGYVFRVRIRLAGNLGRAIPLRWSMIEHPTGRPQRGAAYNQTAAIFRPRGETQTRTWPVWVPSPPRPGAFRVRLTLVDNRRRPLDESESSPFRVRHPPPP
jgi:hypothetical protein